MISYFLTYPVALRTWSINDVTGLMLLLTQAKVEFEVAFEAFSISDRLSMPVDGTAPTPAISIVMKSTATVCKIRVKGDMRRAFVERAAEVSPEPPEFDWVKHFCV